LGRGRPFVVVGGDDDRKPPRGAMRPGVEEKCMLDNESNQTPEREESNQTPQSGSGEPAGAETTAPPIKKAAKRAPRKTAKKTAQAPPAVDESAEPAPAKKAAKRPSRKTAASTVETSGGPEAVETGAPEGAEGAEGADGPAEAATVKTAARKTATKAAKSVAKRATRRSAKKDAEAPAAETTASDQPAPTDASAAPVAAAVLFQAPEAPPVPRKRTARKRAAEKSAEVPRDDEPATEQETRADAGEAAETDKRAETETGEETGEGARRRRRRGGRRRRKGGAEADDGQQAEDSTEQVEKQPEPERTEETEPAQDEADGSASRTRRRRRRRRSGEDADLSPDDPANTVVKVREPRKVSDDEISGVSGSTRLEAKKQRRREGREAGRRRAPIVTEAEFLARRESVDRVMVVRQRADLTQIAVLEDKMLVEHYVARESQTSLIGNVYLGRVQNVLPSMEAAFIDIGKGRNAVLYAGEVNWNELGIDGQPRRIETALKSGQHVLVQITKDPVGHKGARLTSQISLPGRYLVYVPGGQTSGISRKLPDTERNRLKNLLKEILPEEAGVIIRTAAEGASEEELRRDVARLTARWQDIERKVAAGQAPSLLYGEPDLTIKVIRDLFTEDFSKLVVSGDDAWDTIEGYVGHVAPDLMDRVERSTGDGDVFATYRIDEQIAKGLERKVFLPSGGSLVIDRTEAMIVVDVNTGKFTGSGGNLEETVTKNNLEAAEEIVRQLRLRDIGGIVVIDFIDMVLESNRDLVLRRLVECLGRDRTKHQVAEVTSLGLVQMTRKRIGTGLLEAFSETCETCNGRGLIVHHEPVELKRSGQAEERRGKRGRRRGGGEESAQPKGDDKADKADKADGADGADKADVGSDGSADGKTDVKPDASPDAGGDGKAKGRGGRKKAGKRDVSGDVEGRSAAREDERPPEPLEPAEPTPVTAGVLLDQAPVPEPVEPITPPAREEPAPAARRRTRRRAATRPAGPPE
jgi:ribonuclease E